MRTLLVLGMLLLAAGDRGTTLEYRLESGLLGTVSGVLLGRLRAVGAPSPKVSIRAPDRVTVTVGPMAAGDLKFLKELLVRPGHLEFRIVAPEAMEERERRRKREGGNRYPGPPAGYVWVDNVRGPVQRLLVIPEADALKTVSRLERLIRDREGNVPLEVQEELLAAEKKLLETRKANCFTDLDLDREKTVLRVDPAGGRAVYFELLDDRKAAFAEFTRANVGRHLAILIDGKVRSAPLIRAAIPGKAQITGGSEAGFSEDAARNLIVALRTGRLPGPLTLLREFDPE
jgi:preprotein translocase subunit SecD